MAFFEIESDRPRRVCEVTEGRPHHGMAGDALCACGLRPGIVASVSAEPYKRRRKGDLYRDLRMLPNDTDEPIVFFGGKDYLPLFCDLTKDVKAKRTVFYNSGYAPAAQGCALVRFVTTTRTNWHYECARNFNGDLPKRAATVRLADEARKRGRQKLRAERPANEKLKLTGHES